MIKGNPRAKIRKLLNGSKADLYGSFDIYKFTSQFMIQKELYKSPVFKDIIIARLNLEKSKIASFINQSIKQIEELYSLDHEKENSQQEGGQ